MSSEPLNFEPIRNEVRSILGEDEELDILTIFEKAMNSSPNPNIDAKAEKFVVDLVAFSRREDSKLTVKDIAYATWEMLINAASCTPCRHHGQEVLIKVVELLATAGDIWKGYPGFAMYLSEAWNRSPTFQLRDNPEGEDFTLGEWLNLNSFYARLGKRVQNSMWELRKGLEDTGSGNEEKGAPPDTVPEAVTNTRILVASEWIIQAGRELFRESLLGTYSEEPVNGDSWRTGPLFRGPRGFSLERWGFWKRRFVELRGSATELTKKRIGEAVKCMKTIEAEAADAWGQKSGGK